MANFTVGISLGTTPNNRAYQRVSVSKSLNGGITANSLGLSSLEKILTALGNGGKSPPNRFILRVKQAL